MENASKALIIAGAILLAILIISLGILVYNQASSTISDANLDSTEIQTFNNNITQYCGNKKSASDMNGLISAISSSNGAQYGKSDQHFVAVTATDSNIQSYLTGNNQITYASLSSATSTTSFSYPSFSSGITYKASYTTDASGYVNLVTIEKN